MSGFSLIELLLVITLFSIVAAAAYPLSISFYQGQLMSEVQTGLEITLQRASHHARSQKNDSAHGVKLLADSYVLFQGDSYDSRITAMDSVAAFPSSLVHTGIDEIVFLQRTGAATATGTISLEYANTAATIRINAAGVVY